MTVLEERIAQCEACDLLACTHSLKTLTMERVHQLLVWVKKAPIPAFVQIKITEATIMHSYLKPLAAVVVGSDNSNSNSKKKDNSKTKEKKDLTDDDITELMRDFGRALCWTTKDQLRDSKSLAFEPLTPLFGTTFYALMDCIGVANQSASASSVTFMEVEMPDFSADGQIVAVSDSVHSSQEKDANESSVIEDVKVSIQATLFISDVIYEMCVLSVDLKALAPQIVNIRHVKQHCVGVGVFIMSS